jgi:phosphoenolpyruvate carboxylase
VRQTETAWLPMTDNPRMGTELTNDVIAIQAVLEAVRSGLVERQSLVEVLVLAAVAGEHVLVVDSRQLTRRRLDGIRTS